MAITYATLRQGQNNVQMTDYTPEGALSAGDVVVLVSNVGIVHRDIAAGALGALAVDGGIYEFAKVAGSGTAVPKDTLMYWDASGHAPTSTSGSNKILGLMAEASTDAGTTQKILHKASV